MFLELCNFNSAYLVEKLGIEESKIPDLCNLLYKNYGTTMAGLRVIIPSPPFHHYLVYFERLSDHGEASFAGDRL